MSDTTAAAPPAPLVDPGAIKQIAPDVYVIGDRRVPLVPNIGIILGRDAVLVVDTGMGPENGEKVLATAKRLAGGRPLILTLTHFHPEHGFGAQAFKGASKIQYNSAQRDELRAKGGSLAQIQARAEEMALITSATWVKVPSRCASR